MKAGKPGPIFLEAHRGLDGGIRAAYFTEYSVARKRAEPPMTLIPWL
jgi:hypothetical protein